MKNKAELIKKSLLQQCLAGGGSVALGRVARLEPIYQETRGAKVIIHLEIEQQLYGKLPRQVNYWVYGGLDHQMKLPPRLMVAVYPPYEGTEEVEMIASVRVPEGLEAESVQAHQQELAMLGKSSTPSGQ
jgi:hypothetical protein